MKSVFFIVLSIVFSHCGSVSFKKTRIILHEELCKENFVRRTFKEERHNYE